MSEQKDKLQNICLPPGATLRETLRFIDTNSRQMALVVDSERRLLGVVTDGDVRRALLRGEGESALLENIMNKTPKIARESLNEKYDYTVLLQPTSPFRKGEDIDRGIELAVKSGAPSVISVRKASERAEWMCTMDEEGHMCFPYTEAEKPSGTKYILNGAVYVVNSSLFEQNKTFISPESRAFVMSQSSSVDIDTEEDWAEAEQLAKMPDNNLICRI